MIQLTAHQQSVIAKIQSELDRDLLDARRRINALLARYSAKEISPNAFMQKMDELKTSEMRCRENARAEVKGVYAGFLKQRDEFDK